MFDWLTSWFLGVAADVGQHIADAIHWAIHAVASVILAVFDRVYKAWRDMAGWLWSYLLAIGRTLGAIAYKIYAVIRVIIPRVERWVQRLIAYVEKLLRSWVAWLWKQIRSTIALLYREIGRVIRWAWSHIFIPLWRWTQFLFRLVKSWAWVAFWWVTHLDSLAEKLILHLIASLERHAWDIAGRLGRFFLALIIRNLARFVKLAEQIIAAVL